MTTRLRTGGTTRGALPTFEQPESTSECPTPAIAVVVPTYRTPDAVLGVLARVGPEVRWIIVVDDACPEGSGERVRKTTTDPRVEVITLPTNRGVGGATMAGYARALELGADVCVKMDSDGQMPPEFIPTLVAPIVAGYADYAKGNRFHNVQDVRGMPLVRILGNAGLSFFSKMSSGYWNIFDPTNGFTAIHATTLRLLDLAKVRSRFFFESDLLFRLHLAEAVVVDVPMQAHYGNEKSNLSAIRSLFSFAGYHLANFLKRLFYEYFLRDFNVASLQVLFGTLLFAGGLAHGLVTWLTNLAAGVASPVGTIGLVTILVVVGMLMLQNFLAFDYARIPTLPLQQRLARDRAPAQARTHSEAA